MVQRRVACGAVVLAAAIGGCGGANGSDRQVGAETPSSTPTPSPVPQTLTPPRELVDRTFVAEAAEGHPLVTGTTITLSFGDPNMYAATGSPEQRLCNDAGDFQYSVEAGRLRTAPPAGPFRVEAVPAIGCPIKIEAQRAWLRRWLTSRPRVVIDGPNLTLIGGSVTIYLVER